MRKLIAGGLTAALGVLVFASLALASSHNPKGEFAQFGECPLNNAEITDCVFSESNGGFFTVGSKTVPLEKTITLQGGFLGSGEEVKFYGAENGETLSKTPQTVPGGLTGVKAPESWSKEDQEWFNNKINEGATGLTVTVELTGPSKGLTNIHLSTENLLFEEGTALGLPAKIKLNNEKILGNNCYVGSDEKPVQLNFTTGTSGALTGSRGELSFNEAFTLITVKGGALVDGLFASPEAHGCGAKNEKGVNNLVNNLFGLPSASGKNSAVLEGVLKDGAAGAVKASE
jgi:hypothetical protein